jgi:type III secretion system YscQ/HrcQ family protein
LNVSRFDLGACPRVSAAAVRAMRAALPAIAAIPRRWELEAAPGRTLVTLEGFAQEGGDPDAVALPVTLGLQTSRMTVDADFATRLVDAALVGGGAFLSARQFGPAERGVLSGLVGTVFQPLGWRIGLGRVPPPSGREATGCFRIETPVASGRVWLAIAAGSPDAPPTRDMVTRGARALAVLVSAQIAATDLTVRELVALAAGDAVVFTGCPASSLTAEGVWRGELAIGEPAAAHAVDIEIDGRGTITIAGGFEQRADKIRNLRKESEMAASEATGATVALAAAPIEVVAEVGRMRLRGDEVMGLVPGAVLTLPEGRTRVSLRIAGELLAEGELVDVDGELGVRVTRMAAR